MTVATIPTVDLASIRLNGDTISAELREALTAATWESRLDGAVRIELTLRDPHRTLIDSDLHRQRTTVTIDDRTFVLRRPSFRGSQVKLAFDDDVADALMGATGFRTAAEGTVTRAGFIQLLADEAGVAAQVEEREPTRDPISRGSDRPDAPPESSWDAGKRLAREVDVRSFSDGRRWWFGSDDWLATQQVPLIVNASDPAITDLEWAVDVGADADMLEFTATSSRWFITAGHPITVQEQGPASGAVWLSSRVRGDLLGLAGVTVTATRRQQPLPEPDTAHEPFDGTLHLAGAPQIGGVPGAGSSQVRVLLGFAASKIGGPYVWGGNGPRGYDCSGLCHAAAAAAGVHLVRQSMGALRQCERAGTTISVADGIATPGALLFRARPINGVTHIALSRGDGRTIEARGRSYGIGSWSAAGRFDHAALIPGLAYR